MQTRPPIPRLIACTSVLIGGLFLAADTQGRPFGSAGSAATDTVVWADTLEVSAPSAYRAPPAITLTVARDTLRARTGTGCWLRRGCIDAIGIVTDCTATPLPTSFSATLHIAIDLVPTEVRGWVAHVPRDAVPAGGTSWCRWEDQEQGSQLLLLPQYDQQVEMELSEGLHVLFVSAAWRGVGDIHGTFLIECR